MKSAVGCIAKSLVAPVYMKRTANRTRPKVTNAGMGSASLNGVQRVQAGRNDYGRFVPAFQTLKSKSSAQEPARTITKPFDRSRTKALFWPWRFRAWIHSRRESASKQKTRAVLIQSEPALSKQCRLLPAGALLGLDGGNRRHVEHAARRHPRGENMRRTRRPDQDRPDRQRIRQRLDHLVGDVGGVEVRHDQDVGIAFQVGMRQHQLARRGRKRGIALHFAVGLDLRMLFLQKRGGTAHLARGIGVVTAEVGM